MSAESYSYDGPEGVVFDHWRKARKRHTCEVCVTAIEPGTRYLSSWCPGWGTSSLHEGCAELLRNLADDMELESGEGIDYYLVPEFAEEYGYTFDPIAHTWTKGLDADGREGA